MVDARDAADLNLPDAFILFHCKMKGLVLASATCGLTVACAPTAVPPSPVPSPQPNPPLVLPPFQMDASAVDRVPPFRQEPLIEWGPAPEGTAHAERVRAYDLQHQATTIHFDWPRHAVVGTTTLTIGGLAGASPRSNIVIDAGDMTFRRVATTATALKYDYDGHALTVHLATPLCAGQKTSITIEYDGANRSKGAYFRPARHIVWTQGETEDTHYWVPTYDFPNDKTTWEFYMWTAKGERA